MAFTTYTLIQNVDGAYHVRTIHAPPIHTDDLLSITVPVDHKHQIMVWFPMELPLETAQAMAARFAGDMRKDLAES